MQITRSISALVILSLPAMAWGAESRASEYMNALRATPDLAQGEARFQTCATCHGSDGGGTADGNIPRIAGQHFSVLVRQMIEYRHGKRWDIRMESYTDRHLLANSQSIADVAYFVSQLQSIRSPGLGKGDLLDHGAKLYERSCRECHGETAQGNPGKAVPQLAGQHYEYLLRQIYDAVDGRRPNLPRAHVRLLARLERDDITSLADFLSRSQWTTASITHNH
jgi:cytochrome c553